MKKRFLVCALLACAIPLTTAVGCFQKSKSIVSVEKGESVGLVDNYTVTYSDGTTSSFSVTNTDRPKTIVSIDKSESVGLVDYYIITYSDGTTSSYSVTNGKDGNDAAAITVDDVYEFYKQTNPNATKEEFIGQFLSVDGGSSEENLTALSSLFRSGMKIYTVFKERTFSYISGSTETENVFKGSAVLYKIAEEYAYILTNYHMVYDENAVTEEKTCIKAFAYMYGSDYAPVQNAETGEITADDAFALNCEYVGGSAECDVAVVKVKTEELKKIYPYAQGVTVNTSYEVGQTVYAIGNPDDAGLSLTRGIISVDLENVLLEINGKRYYHLLRTDADLDHGSSGGGLFNEQGELIALCNSGDDGIQSINFAIPATTMQAAADNIMYYNMSADPTHKGYRLLLGVTMTEQNCRYVYDEQTKSGKITADVTLAQPAEGEENPVSGKPAKIMGLQVGDIIRAISINGVEHKLNRMFEVSNYLMLVRAGDSVTLTYERGGVNYTTEAYAVTADDLTEI